MNFLFDLISNAFCSISFFNNIFSNTYHKLYYLCVSIIDETTYFSWKNLVEQLIFIGKLPSPKQSKPSFV